ncbi:MAG: type II secretion system GspH family protein [Lachnospiraceae bacterium]|nr:type II secretion system GspH family protein [Lachnospiraceae bacterium]
MKSSDLKNNRGLSLVELIVVIAIMAILIGAAGFGLSLLFGTEAKQAAYRTEAELNDAKTGTLTKAGEDIVIRYIAVPDKKTDPDDYEDYSKKGVEKSGYYADKCTYTIIYNTAPDKSNLSSKIPESVYEQEHEYSYIGSGSVEINIIYKIESGEEKTEALGSDQAIKISYDRETGEFKKIELGGNYDIGGSFTAAKTLHDKVNRHSYTPGLEKFRMDFVSGARVFSIIFAPLTGNHSISAS